MKFSFCESSLATPFSPWHIRELSEKGRKLGGGIDTKFLCRDYLISGWDLDVPFDENRFKSGIICKKCAEKYFKLLTRATAPRLAKGKRDGKTNDN